MPTLELQAQTENLPQVLSFVHQTLSHSSCAAKTILQIDLAVEEIFVNIANYAYGSAQGSVCIDCSLHGSVLTIVIRDQGIAFNPLEQKPADTTLSAQERPIGGLGIFLTKKIMTTVTYERLCDSNVLTLTKELT